MTEDGFDFLDMSDEEQAKQKEEMDGVQVLVVSVDAQIVGN